MIVKTNNNINKKYLIISIKITSKLDQLKSSNEGFFCLFPLCLVGFSSVFRVVLLAQVDVHEMFRV